MNNSQNRLHFPFNSTNLLSLNCTYSKDLPPKFAPNNQGTQKFSALTSVKGEKA